MENNDEFVEQLVRILKKFPAEVRRKEKAAREVEKIKKSLPKVWNLSLLSSKGIHGVSVRLVNIGLRLIKVILNLEKRLRLMVSAEIIDQNMTSCMRTKLWKLVVSTLKN
jgi:hypothetical protein